MRRTASSLLSALVIATCVTPAAAYDQPISATKLDVKNVGGKQQLTFLSKDAAALFGVPGSADDPTVSGALVEILSSAEPSASFFAPTGDWADDAALKRRYLYINRFAPYGSAIRKLHMKEDKMVQVLAKASGLTLATPTTRVAVRITMGALRNCAVFESATFRRNEPGRLLAMKAPVPPIADCSDASLLGTAPACGESAPACDGPCPGTASCVAVSGPGGSGCACLPSCGNGFVYIGPNPEGFPPGCYPNLCSGTYPTCGGPCGSGGTCYPFNAADGAFTNCLCATPAACNAGGFECAPGDVCYINGVTPGCNPP